MESYWWGMIYYYYSYWLEPIVNKFTIDFLI
jgi:hypothetical protein